jgi:signal transduction histidine kinase
MSRRPFGFLFSAWPIRSFVYLLTGAVLGFLLLVLLTAMLVVGAVLSLAVIGVLVLALTVLICIPVAELERHRIRLVDHVPLIGAHPPVPGVGAAQWLRIRLRERATWRELNYLVTHALLLSVLDLCVVAFTTLSVAVLLLPLLVAMVSPDVVMLGSFGVLSSPLDALPYAGLGLLATILSGYLLCLVASGHVVFARLLLSSREDELGHRVTELAMSRARLVDGFEAERRRIERDLHDGAQQRLVSLTMTLGLAAMELPDTDSEASRLVRKAREEAKLVLAELRDLIRGIHPQVLTDRGIAAAVHELAARCPLPVSVDIELPSRLPTAVETVAYFAVCEALTNAVKHSSAEHCSVYGRISDDTLDLQVRDDGHGGLDPASGTGLQGMVDRLAVVGGRLEWSSPAGGSTVLRMEIPCHNSRFE